MKAIKQFLFKLMGEKAYLLLVSRVYIGCINAGLLKKSYPELHFLQKQIKPGFVCLDFGANVGYYSYFLSKYSAPNGKVHAVEPVPLFAEVFKYNTIKCKNIILHQVALGEQEGMAYMSTPVVNGVFRHGLTKVVDKKEADKAEHRYEVPMKNPNGLFGDLPRLDYIKCDVEGYEIYLLPQISALVKHHKPTIQVEITGENNRSIIFEWMQDLAYNVHCLKDNALEEMTFADAMLYNTGDFYFKPAQ